MSCFWRHDWSNWTEVYQQSIAGGVGRYIDMQKRACGRCNKIEERRV
jgi:hypothetical protein